MTSGVLAVIIDLVQKIEIGSAADAVHKIRGLLAEQVMTSKRASHASTESLLAEAERIQRVGPIR